jgi:hypothetical protein
MKVHYAFFACLTLSVFASGCCAGDCSRFQPAVAGNPESEAQKALSDGDRRVLLVAGLTTEAPGVEDAALVERLGHREIEGTSDTASDDSCRAFQTDATQYAERYNRKILALSTE